MANPHFPAEQQKPLLLAHLPAPLTPLLSPHPHLASKQKTGTARAALKKNPLRNLGALLKLNPYAKVARRAELLAAQKGERRVCWVGGGSWLSGGGGRLGGSGAPPKRPPLSWPLGARLSRYSPPWSCFPC